MNTIFGRKIEQKQGFLEDGSRIPLTVIRTEQTFVTDIKTLDKHGYSAVQVGFGQKKKGSKAVVGHVKKANLSHVPFLLKELRMNKVVSQLGDTVMLEDVLHAGDIIDVTGVSKGKGFAGGVKRYHFRGGPRTHGQSDRERAPGSIGQTTTPGRVYKGKKMAGNMGRDQVTVKNLLVIEVDAINKTVLVKGLVPGILKGVVEVTKVGEMKEKKFVPLFKVAQEEAEVVDAAAVEAQAAEAPLDATTEPVELETEIKEEAK